MKILVVFSVILVPIVSRFPKPKSWGLPEIENIMGSEAYVEPNLLQCLNVAYDMFLYGIKDTKSLRRYKLSPETDLKATVPSPEGKDTWDVDDLMNAAIKIVDNVLLDENMRAKARDRIPLTLEEVKDVLDILTPVSGRVKSTEQMINIRILEVLYSVMMEAEDNVKVLREGYKVEVPMLDISIWSANELHTALKKSNLGAKLQAYLNLAILQPKHYLDDGETFCVITPVNEVPTNTKYYFLPLPTKTLLSQIKTDSKRNMW